jgi:hypothetical protein
MPPKLYELKVFKGTNRVRGAAQLLESLDLADPVATKDLLRRHLLAVAERDGASRRNAHLYHLDVHEFRDGRPENKVLFTFSVPVEA